MQIYKDLIQWEPEWLAIRKWVITWTKLEWVLGWPKAQLTEMYSLLAEKYLVEEDLRPFEIIERWHELEPIAKAKYEAMFLNGRKIVEVGFVLKNEWLGLSPDWLIKTWYHPLTKLPNGKYSTITDDIYWKAIEIKCPRGKNYIKYMLENKIPDEYKWQVVNYFVVIDDLQELDFVIYNPDVCEGLKDLHVITVKREELQKDIEKAQERLTEFKKDWDNMNDLLMKK